MYKQWVAFRLEDAVDFGPAIMGEEFYAAGIHCPITSPIRYISEAETADPFGAGLVPHGYDSLPLNTDRLAYGAIFGIGPDHTAGDWRRNSRYTVDTDGDGLREGLPYNPTNGTNSRGDFWRVVPNDTRVAKDHFEPLVW